MNRATVAVTTGHGSACNPLSAAGVDVVPVEIRSLDGNAVDANFVFHMPTE